MSKTKEKPIPGQRWVNENEPELGLGIVMTAEYGRVELFFPAANERRLFALESAPLSRVRFQPGDRIMTHEGTRCAVDLIREEEGLLVYVTAEGEIPEAQLSDQISISAPEDRLMAGQVDDPGSFNLRLGTLQQRERIRRSEVRGFVGARIDLIPHQLSIVAEVTSRLCPRVLLADEVGLGKTIEACLIMHRLHLCGRADRVLILLPEPLVNQWFVELMRRFNMMFSLYDEERCRAVEPDTNPFLDSQLVIAPLDFISEHEDRAAQLLEAEWDLLIVDEAHHIEWTPKEPSREYAIVEALASQTNGLLLLTATPQQLGAEGHFARLRLLDPERYDDLESFMEEQKHYEEVASLLDSLDSGKLSQAQKKLISALPASVGELWKNIDREGVKEKFREQLLDSFGTGRVLFRNKRSSLSGFPQRKLHKHPLEDGTYETKVDWLVELLIELKEEKVLLICKTRAQVERIAKEILQRRQVKLAEFHEGLNLLQRDRNAAYFAEEEGARILLCSEIGSEGRNFQFAHHLVLYDLPDNPELLEQRIGRLDRIGQTETIHIHVPYADGKSEAVRVAFYHEGLNAFEQSLPGATEIMRTLSEAFEACVSKPTPSKLKALIASSVKVRKEVVGKLQRGQDRLLELNSARPGKAEACIAGVSEWDNDRSFESFVMDLFETLGVHVEEYGSQCYKLGRGYHREEMFAAIPEEGQMFTFSRDKTLGREDQGFMSCDHPLVRGAIDGLLVSERGNAVFAVIDSEIGEPESIFLEVVHVLECVAPASLHVDRFLPPTSMLCRLDHSMSVLGGEPFDPDALEPDNPHGLIKKEAFRRDLFPQMMERALEEAESKKEGIIEGAIKAMNSKIDAEVGRLKSLQELNDHVSDDDIASLLAHKEELATAIQSARIRCEAVRLVWKR